MISGLAIPRLLPAVLLVACACGDMVEPEPETERISRHTLVVAAGEPPVSYLIYHPAIPTPPTSRALLIYLYGAYGSIKDYNLQHESYATLRADLARRGYSIVVPELGPLPFMNAQAKHLLDAIVDQVLADNDIDAQRVGIMGTSMGAGSALAYAIHRPETVHAVCAVMPMTDFAVWTREVPRWAPVLTKAYGGTPEEKPEAYGSNSAMENLGAFENMPLFLIHGDADTTVPYENSKRLADALKARGYPCTFRTAPGAKHSDEVMTDFQHEVADFFDEALKNHHQIEDRQVK